MGHTQVSAPVQSLRTGTVHQVVGGQLVKVYSHHPITPSVIEDHWAAMSNPSGAFRRYIVSMDDGLAIMAPAPVTAPAPVPTEEQPVTQVQPPVVNRWYLEKFGAQRYYEQEVPKPARRQGPKKQEILKPASPQAGVPQLSARSQVSAAQQPFTLPSGAIQTHLEVQEVLKPVPFPTPAFARWQDFGQYQPVHSMQAEAYRQYLKQAPFQYTHSMLAKAHREYLEREAQESAPLSFSAPVAAQQQAPFQPAHSMQAEAYPNPAYGQLFEQPAPQALAQEQEVLKPASVQALADDQMPGGGMEYNVEFGDFDALSESQSTPATLESRERVFVDLTVEEEEKEQVPVSLSEVETEDEWVIINPSQEIVDEVRRAENKKLTERKKELSRVLNSGAARRWYNSFISAPINHQRAYCNQYWGSDQLALDDVKELIQYFDDFTATRLHRLSYEAMANDPPLVPDDNGGERPMTFDEIQQAVQKDLRNLRTQKSHDIMSHFEPITSKRKRSKAAEEPQPEEPAKKQKKARKPKTLPTPSPEDSDVDAVGDDDDEDLVTPQALLIPTPDSTELDSGLEIQAEQYELSDELVAEFNRAYEQVQWEENPTFSPLEIEYSHEEGKSREEQSNEDEDKNEDKGGSDVPAALTVGDDGFWEEWTRLNPNWDSDEDEDKDESGEPAAVTADNDRALEEWKRLNPDWAAEDSDEDEKEEKMACDGASSSEESEEE
jgi:hypothetical protein